MWQGRAGPGAIRTELEAEWLARRGLAIIPQPGANYIKIADEYYKRLAEIQKGNATDIQLSTLIDGTRNVRRSLLEVEETLLIAFSWSCSSSFLLP